MIQEAANPAPLLPVSLAVEAELVAQELAEADLAPVSASHRQDNSMDALPLSHSARPPDEDQVRGNEDSGQGSVLRALLGSQPEDG